MVNIDGFITPNLTLWPNYIICLLDRPRPYPFFVRSFFDRSIFFLQKKIFFKKWKIENFRTLKKIIQFFLFCLKTRQQNHGMTQNTFILSKPVLSSFWLTSEELKAYGKYTDFSIFIRQNSFYPLLRGFINEKDIALI